MFTSLEKAWLKQSIGTQLKALHRNRLKEINGGEVYLLRGKEIDTLNTLLTKVEGIQHETIAPEASKQKPQR